MPQATHPKVSTKYALASTREVAVFLDSVEQAADAGGASLLDSVRGNANVKIPQQLDKLLGLVPSEQEGGILDAIDRGMSVYQQRHGVAPTADLVEAAIQQGLSARYGIDSSGRVLDNVVNSASSSQSETVSLQSNRAVVAIVSAIAEAVPFGAYLPVDIGSNQSKLAILSHMSGSDYGDYRQGDHMDGVSAGDVLTSSQRMVRISQANGQMPNFPFQTRFSVLNDKDDAGFCDPNANAVPVLRHRTLVYVNGTVAAMEPVNGGSDSSPLSGSITIGGTTHTIAGSVVPKDGLLSITSITPALPAGTEVFAQGFVDYERSPGLIPSVVVRADTFDLFANPWRVMTKIGIDSSTQLRNELGLDGNSEALLAIRTQMSMERHYQCLRYVDSLSRNISAEHDFGFTIERAQKVRAEMWLDFASTLGHVDQRMAEKTMDHGITHLYVGAFIAAQLQALPREIFEPSGMSARPSIYRVGRLFGKYEVYYSPKIVKESADLSESTILAVGRSSQAARCPVVLGDAVAPTFLPLALNADFQTASGMYARDFTNVNPHGPSAAGCARIRVYNLK